MILAQTIIVNSYFHNRPSLVGKAKSFFCVSSVSQKSSNVRWFNVKIYTSDHQFKHDYTIREVLETDTSTSPFLHPYLIIVLSQIKTLQATDQISLSLKTVTTRRASKSCYHITITVKICSSCLKREVKWIGDILTFIHSQYDYRCISNFKHKHICACPISVLLHSS